MDIALVRYNEVTGTSTLYGYVSDQGTLFGVLNYLYTLGLSLMLVQRIHSSEEEESPDISYQGHT